MLKPYIILLAVLAFARCSASGKQENNHMPLIDTIIGSTLKNINEAEHSVLQFEVDGKHCFATINQSFKNYPHKQAFPFSLWINVETKQRNSNGHPTGEEATLFNNLEDSLITSFDGKTPFCFIGRTTRDGYREIMLYVRDKRKASEIMDNFIKTTSFKRMIKYEITSDENWESVGGFY